jgi:hypothetical protein
LAIAIGTGVGGTSTSNNILRTSSDNGETWTDTSTNLFVEVNRSTKLFYNNGRYFVIAGSNATNPMLYASASNLSSWTAPVTSAGDIYNDMAFSNTTALVVGSNGSSSACYSSTNNGANWSALPSSPISYSGAATINTATYAHGLWAVAGRDPAGFSSVSYSSNLTTWTETAGSGPGDLQVACEDGGAWQFVGPVVSVTGVWQLSGLPTLYSGLAGGYGFSTKRLVTRAVSNGTPTLTLSIPYDPSDIAFVSPTQTSYINWQFVPIAPITVQTTPSEFKYYYASGLPDGLTFTNDPLGLSATISGTSVAYSDAAQRVLLYVARGSNVAATSLTMRTILPTVTKIQAGASGVTSLLRQYTEVNAAVTARDSRALPAMEYRLGEFTSPEPPSVITATADKCDC